MKTSSLTECTNNGALSAPSGRSGGIVAVATSGQVTACVNNGKVQDDVNGIFGANPGYKRMGGLAGGASADAAFTSCVNNGDVFSQLGCRTGGFVGHNEAKITKCENKGVILSDHTLSGTNYHGSGWAAGYNKSADLITECVVGGHELFLSVDIRSGSSDPAGFYYDFDRFGRRFNRTQGNFDENNFVGGPDCVDYFSAGVNRGKFSDVFCGSSYADCLL